MVVIGTMDIRRGFKAKKRGGTTKKPVVSKLVYHFPKPDKIRWGNVFYLATPDLSKYAQLYCVKYFNAPLLAYAEY